MHSKTSPAVYDGIGDLEGASGVSSGACMAASERALTERKVGQEGFSGAIA
jgi:hypothetical protein